MAYAGRLFNPIKQSLTAITTSSKSISHSTQLFYGKFESLKTWRNSLEPLLHSNIARFQYKLNIQSKYVQNFSMSGSKSFGCIFGVSVAFGSICFRPHVMYAINGHDGLFDDYHVNLSGGSDVQEDPFAFWTFVRKFWLPAFFVLTVFVNWNHPITLGIKIFLLLLSTKPSPLSVYLYVEQLCRQSMRQKPHLYLFKTLYANKVDVQDYKLLCLARVEVGDQNLTLVGLLGGWWALPSSLGVFSALRTLLRSKKSPDFPFEFIEF